MGEGDILGQDEIEGGDAVSHTKERLVTSHPARGDREFATTELALRNPAGLRVGNLEGVVRE